MTLQQNYPVGGGLKPPPSQVSRLREFHPQSLAKRSVNLSIHSAPIRTWTIHDSSAQKVLVMYGISSLRSYRPDSLYHEFPSIKQLVLIQIISLWLI